MMKVKDPKKETSPLKGCLVGIQLRDGNKLFGPLVSFSKFTVWIEDEDGDPIDVPRNIIRRMFILINGKKE